MNNLVDITSTNRRCGWAGAAFFRILQFTLLLTLLLTLLPFLAALFSASRHTNTHLSLAVVAWHASPTFVTMALVKPLLASLAVSGLLGLLSLWAWPREGAWVRLLRLSGLLWVTALAIFPGFGSWVPVVCDLPWIATLAVGVLGLAILHVWPRIRPGAKELVFSTLVIGLFYVNLPRMHPNVSRNAGRSLNARDVIILGLDSVTYADVAEVVVGFRPSHGSKVVFTSAWTPVASTGIAWRSMLSGLYPETLDLLPGARWPGPAGPWLPRELQALGYRTTMFQDDPATNLYYTDEQVQVPTTQGWKSNPQAPHEAGLLQLSTDKAHALLRWSPVWSFSAAVEQTVNWYRETRKAPQQAPDLTRQQIQRYQADAAKAEMSWAR